MAAKLIHAGLAAAIAAAVAAPAFGADDPPPRPRQIDALYACQAIADPGQRLACFDEAVRSVRRADTSGEVIFADREQVKKAKRGLFGLGNIRLGIFSRGEDDPEDQELKEMTAPVRAIDTRNFDRWVIVLEDGARWMQTEAARKGPGAEKSKTVTIKRGALGSYTMVFENGNTMKVKRIL